MSKLLTLFLLAFLLLGGYYLYNKSTNVADEFHEVPIPVEGEKVSEALFTEKMYDVNSTDVQYFENVTGYYSEPNVEGEFPGVVVIHEWWGLNSHIRDMADELAAQGYRVLAVDLFGTVATTPEQARAQISSLDQQRALQNLSGAKSFLEDKGALKIASLGWCFGGGQSLQMSLNQEVDATVIYYGNLITEIDELEVLDSPVLGIFGSEDSSIPVDDVNDFERSLTQLGIQNDINIYEGVGHAFANPSGNNFSPDETKDAWNKTLQFLEDNLK